MRIRFAVHAHAHQMHVHTHQTQGLSSLLLYNEGACTPNTSGGRLHNQLTYCLSEHKAPEEYACDVNTTSNHFASRANSVRVHRKHTECVLVSQEYRVLCGNQTRGLCMYVKGTDHACGQQVPWVRGDTAAVCTGVH